MSRCIDKITLILLCLSTLLHASQLVKMAQRPAWIIPVSADVSAEPKSGEAAGYYYQLLDYQYNIVSEETYTHFVYKILTSEGVQQMSDITVNFDPVYQRLFFHKVKIHRDGKIIDQLASLQNLRLIQREESMDRYLYDGSLTAVLHLRDVRAGDIIECDYTRKGYNPVYEGHFAFSMYLEYSQPFERLHNRIVCPLSKKLNMKNFNCDAKPRIQKTAKTTEFTWDIPKTSALIQESNSPPWFDPYRRVVVTDFTSWNQVAAWASKYFTVDNKELQKLKKRIRNRFKNEDKEKLAVQIIRFVQDEIRYLGFESGLNSHKPHPPTKVFDQRFGDCKDKSLLLSAMLNAYGVEAYPMLVNTRLKNEIKDMLPSHTVFDHCVVQIYRDGKGIAIDPTCSNQGGDLASYTFPFSGWGLVLQPKTGDLAEITNVNNSIVKEEQVFTLDSIGGSADVTVKTIYRGRDADRQRVEFANKSLESVQKLYVDYFSDIYSDIESSKPIEISDDRDSNVYIVREHYHIKTFWKPFQDDSNKIYCEIYSLAMENLVNVPKSTSRKEPYSLGDPSSYQQTFTIQLPETWNITPQDTSIHSPYYSFRYKTSQAEDTVTVFFEYTTISDHIPPDSTIRFVEDHKAMKDNLSYYLTYNKRVSSGRTLSWVMVVVAALSLLLALALGGLLYFAYDPQPRYRVEKEEKIDGILILYAIAITATPLGLLWYISATPEYFNNVWAVYWKAHSWGLSVLTIVKTAGIMASLVFSFVVAVLFYQKRSSFPLVMTVYFCSFLLMIIIYSVLFDILGNGTISKQTYHHLNRVLAVAFIWLPYFCFSKKVKMTFVQRLPKSAKEKVELKDIPVYPGE